MERSTRDNMPVIKGHSTTDALLCILQPIYEATDSGNAGARLFLLTFLKVSIW